MLLDKNVNPNAAGDPAALQLNGMTVVGMIRIAN